MANIKLNRDELLKAKELIEIMKFEGTNSEYMKEFLNLLIPRIGGVTCVRNKVRTNGVDNLKYVPVANSIIGSYSRLDKWSYLNARDFGELFNVKDLETLRIYLMIFALAHEVEHSYQGLAGSGKQSTGIRVVDDSYRELINLFFKVDTIIPRPIKQAKRAVSLMAYKKNENSYVIERNANAEAFEFISLLGQRIGDEEISRAFDKARRQVLIHGYVHNTQGSICETFKSILMEKEYRDIFRYYLDDKYAISDYDKVRFGLPVSKEVREDVLRLKF